MGNIVKCKLLGLEFYVKLHRVILHSKTSDMLQQSQVHCYYIYCQAVVYNRHTRSTNFWTLFQYSSRILDTRTAEKSYHYSWQLIFLGIENITKQSTPWWKQMTYIDDTGPYQEGVWDPSSQLWSRHKHQFLGTNRLVWTGRVRSGRSGQVRKLRQLKKSYQSELMKPKNRYVSWLRKLKLLFLCWLRRQNKETSWGWAVPSSEQA